MPIQLHSWVFVINMKGNDGEVDACAPATCSAGVIRRGGKRKGAGRKPNGARAGASHHARPEVRAQHALHVVMRVVPTVGNLRRRNMYKAMQAASIPKPTIR
jgi:hypothetical protein